MFPRIENKDFIAHYDPNKQIACVVLLDKVFDARFLKDVYQWIESLQDDSIDVHAILWDCGSVNSFVNTLSDDTEKLTTNADLLSLPLVMIIENNFQQRKLESFINSLPQIQNKHIFSDYEAGFNHIATFHDFSQIELPDTTTSTNHYSLWGNRDTGYITVIYYGVVTAQTTVDVYADLGHVISEYGIENVKAGSFDFRHVKGFDNSNLRTVQRSSGTINQHFDLSRVAVPLIVGNFSQEQMVRLAMKISPQEERKKIVFNEDAAYEFITAFHKSIEAQSS
jgi:hypothetical protein